MLLQCTSGVFLSLNGMTIPNDGYVLASDIGTDDGGLHCNTDRSDCCRTPDGTIAQGHWYCPDGSQVGSFTAEDSNDPSRNFFSRSRSSGVVRLNHYGNPPQRGRFHCEIPNASGVIMTLYINIGEWFISSRAVWTLYMQAYSVSHHSSGCATNYISSHSVTCGYHHSDSRWGVAL